MNGRKLNGVITEVDPRLGQTVQTDAAEEHLKTIFLHGWNRIKGNPPVGAKVELEYRVDYRSGLWWGTVVEEKV